MMLQTLSKLRPPLIVSMLLVLELFLFGIITQAGELVLSNGQTLPGSPTLGPKGVTLLTNPPAADAPSYALGDLKSATFSPAASDEQTGLTAEVFGDEAMKTVARTLRAATVNYVDIKDRPMNLRKYYVRHTGQLIPPYTGQYTISLDSREGARMWVGDTQVIDAWSADPIADDKAGAVKVELEAGRPVDFRLETRQTKGDYVAVLQWQCDGMPKAIIPADRFRSPAPKVGDQPVQGVLGEYFNYRFYDDVSFTNRRLMRIDPFIAYNWGLTEPAPFVANDFTARWRGWIIPQFTETYKIFIRADQGCQLWLDDKLIASRWPHPNSEETVHEVAMTAGRPVKLWLNFADPDGPSDCTLSWESATQNRQPIPTECLRPWSAEDQHELEEKNHVRVEYFEGREFEKPLIVRREPNVDGTWGVLPTGQGTGWFSVRYTAMLRPPQDGNYVFSVPDDNGSVEIFVNDKSVVKRHPGAPASGPVALKKDEPVSIRFDFRAATPEQVQFGYRGRALLYWTLPDGNRGVIPPSAFEVSPGEPKSLPLVRFVVSGEGKYLSNAGVPLRCKIDGPTAADVITRVDYVLNNKVIGSSTTAPFDAEWKSPEVGLHQIIARATDKSGISVDSFPETVVVNAPADEGQLREPWQYQRLNAGKRATKLKAVDDTLTFEGAKGLIWTDRDELDFVYADLPADATLVFRVDNLVTHAAPVATDEVGKVDKTAPGRLVVSVRDDRDDRASYGGFAFGSDGSLFYVFRDRRGEQASAELMSPNIGPYFRLQSDRSKITLSSSVDARNWALVRTIDFNSDKRSVIGFAAISDGDDTFDASVSNIQLYDADVAASLEASGILLRQGSFLAGPIRQINPADVRLFHQNRDVAIARSEIAAVVHSPIKWSQMNQIPPQSTGLLLSSGDFVEGDIARYTLADAEIMNVILGPIQSDIKAMLAAVFSPPPPPNAKRFIIRLTDGSRLVADKVDTLANALRVEELSNIGHENIPAADILRIDINNTKR